MERLEPQTRQEEDQTIIIRKTRLTTTPAITVPITKSRAASIYKLITTTQPSLATFSRPRVLRDTRSSHQAPTAHRRETSSLGRNTNVTPVTRTA